MKNKERFFCPDDYFETGKPTLAEKLFNAMYEYDGPYTKSRFFDFDHEYDEGKREAEKHEKGLEESVMQVGEEQQKKSI